MNVLSAVVGLSFVLGGGATVPPESQRLLEGVLSACASQAGSDQPNVGVAPLHAEEVLAAHAQNCSPEELDALADEALRMGKALSDGAAREGFGYFVGRAVPGDAGLRVMATLMLTEEKNPWVAQSFLYGIMERRCPSQLAADTVIALHREYSSLPPEHLVIQTESLAVQALGATGPGAVDYLISLGTSDMNILEALGRIGNSDALEYLIHVYGETKFTHTQVHCVGALAGKDLLWRTPEVVAFVRTELSRLLADSDPLIREDAAEFAGLSGDPFFYPALEQLAQMDTSARPVTRKGYDPTTDVTTETVTDTLVVREKAAESVKSLRIRMEDHRIRERVSELKSKIDYLKQDAEAKRKFLAAEKLRADTQAQLRRERDEALQQLPALEAELAEVQARQEAHIQRVVAETLKNAQVP